MDTTKCLGLPSDARLVKPIEMGGTSSSVKQAWDWGVIDLANDSCIANGEQKREIKVFPIP